jgi:hypothetical protein
MAQSFMHNNDATTPMGGVGSLDSIRGGLRMDHENRALESMLNNYTTGLPGVNSQFLSMANSTRSTTGLPQMNSFMPQTLMNNHGTGYNLGCVDSLNSMNNSMAITHSSSPFGSLVNNCISRSMARNQHGVGQGYSVSGMNMNQQMNMNNNPSSVANASNSRFDGVDLPPDQQACTLVAHKFKSNHEKDTNMESLGINDHSNGPHYLSNAVATTYEQAAAPFIQQPHVQEDQGWDDQYRALQAYRLQFGDCNVPARYKSNAKLGRWVMTQRHQFTLLTQGLQSALTMERIQRLDGVGFAWSVRPEQVRTWNIKFQELKGKIIWKCSVFICCNKISDTTNLAYKATFGNCMVPQRYRLNPQLGTWVQTQRRQYKLMTEGRKSSMTKNKADTLDSIGFFWTAKPHTAQFSGSKNPPDDSNISRGGNNQSNLASTA